MANNILNSEGKIVKVLDTKPRFDLIDPNYTLGLACTLTHGAYFYAPYSWRDVPKDDYIGALGRHFNAYQRDEIFDPKSHLFHLDHLTACAIFLLWHSMQEQSNEKYIKNIIKRGLYVPKKGVNDV